MMPITGPLVSPRKVMVVVAVVSPRAIWFERIFIASPSVPPTAELPRAALEVKA
ncbi:hypothetical protein D3C87_1394790 [compost metagenome]